jgi:hypothetical protein
MTGIAMGESPRWHENRLWFSDWGAREILAVDPNGKSEIALRVPFGLPFCIDWLPDGRLLVVSGRDGLLLRREQDGSLVTHADLHGPAGMGWNEIVVDGRGNVYINGGEGIALLTFDGSLRQVADGIAFPNGMAITPDNSTLIVAESHGKKLTAFAIACRTGACGLTSETASLTASASMPMVPSGTPMFPTSDAYASAKAVKCCRLSLSTAAVSLACWVAKRRKRCTSSPLSGAAWTKLPKLRKHEPGKCSPSRRQHPTLAGHRKRTKHNACRILRS